MSRSFLVRSSILLVLGVFLLGCPSDDGGSEPPGPDGAGEPAAETDTVDFSFVVFGCNRRGYDEPTPPSTANIPQLTRTVADIATLPTAPRYLFMLGDLVRNEVQDDGTTLEQQLTAWQTVWDGLKAQLPDTQLVPVPGNHEVLYSTKVHVPEGCDCDTAGCTCRYDEFPNPDAYGKWLQWMRTNGYDSLAGNGPTPATDPEDQLVLDDSKQLTYSFQTDLSTGRKAHFVLVDTDTLSTYRATDPACIQDAQNADNAVPGWMPAHWVGRDIATAQADPAVDLI
ncbi:MAG: metallophosphoesterase family protein, partial [Acidobacteriota bacterium]